MERLTRFFRIEDNWPSVIRGCVLYLLVAGLFWLGIVALCEWWPA